MAVQQLGCYLFQRPFGILEQLGDARGAAVLAEYPPQASLDPGGRCPAEYRELVLDTGVTDAGRRGEPFRPAGTAHEKRPQPRYPQWPLIQLGSCPAQPGLADRRAGRLAEQLDRQDRLDQRRGGEAGGGQVRHAYLDRQLHVIILTSTLAASHALAASLSVVADGVRIAQ